MRKTSSQAARRLGTREAEIGPAVGHQTQTKPPTMLCRLNRGTLSERSKKIDARAQADRLLAV